MLSLLFQMVKAFSLLVPAVGGRRVKGSDVDACADDTYSNLTR